MRILLGLICLFCTSTATAAESSPNIVFLLCDDMGYGDVRCFNPQGKIPTPHMDRLAAEGMIFTDAHSGSAVCSPTRYGVITGRYSWRSRLQRGVLGGLSPRLIEPERGTVASFLKQQGYHTACIGKWHLGMDWVKRPGKDVAELNIESPDQVWNVDYSQPIANGPNAVGFDYYMGISASLDMVPYTFIENDRVTALPTEDRAFAMMAGRSPSKTRLGPAAPSFDAADVLPKLTESAVDYIEQRASQAAQGKPFFLYVPFASPHTPILPTADWEGKTGLNPYADFVMQNDWAIGQIAAALKTHGLDENTLLIVTSDNGCSPQAKFDELAAKGHHPSAMLRGHKADIYEGGHRVPFIVRWPARVRPGTRSEQLVCLTDLLATAADVLKVELPPDLGEDSVSFLPALQEQAQMGGRESVIHHSINGSFAIREGRWKLVLCPGSGGWSSPRPGRDDTSELPRVQLFDLQSDIGEEQNLQDKHPEVVARLKALLEKQVAEGRSTTGPAQKNTVPVDIWKAAR